ncbi:MAG: hypothetical protein CVV03_01930 [Firmicutes bacterium HGW-Firmicutes-8]|nr:MAG: hypothetical protein CVV03_01930 [Firmicutes bacterium HGW-Firmicutes-8]
MGLPSIESIELRLSIQIMAFLVALIVTQMAVVEWRRNRNAMYKYLALGFGIMFAQIIMMTVILANSRLVGSPAFQNTVNILDYSLRVASFIYLAAAFTTVKSSFRSRFISSNLVGLIIFAPIAWMFLSLNGTAARQLLVISWVELVFQLWITGLLLHTVLAILNSDVRMKKGLVIATSLLLVRQAIHFLNSYFGPELIPVLSLLEQSLIICYFYVIITTLHKQIIADLVIVDLEKDQVKEKAHQDTIRALINSLEAKDLYTRGHSDRVTEYAMVIGQKLGFDHEELTKLYYGAILHDIGKIGISEEILNNPLSLCRDEFDCMKKHPEIGATIVTSIESLKNIAPSILYHHERYDGSGYPKGLKGKEIPLHSRIIAITDALDAMSSSRTYRDSLTEENAIHELITGAGTQFDPDLVKSFVDALGIKLKEADYKTLDRSA